MTRISHCEHCGRKFGPYLVLHGHQPCLCGGHRYAYCRGDTGGCGQYTYDPQMRPETCRDAPFGFSGDDR